MTVFNKLEGLSLARLQDSIAFAGMAGAHPSETPFWCSTPE